MRRIASSVIACLSVAISGAVTAQDLFSSTNSTEHSYNYLEVQYLLDTEASPPVLATLLVNLTDSWSFKAEFSNQDFSDASDELGLDALLEEEGLDPDAVNARAGIESRWISAGVLYFKPLANLERSDWIAGLMYGQIDVTVDITLRFGPPLPPFLLEESEDFNFQEFYIGIRRTFSPNLEGEATINRFQSSDLFSETTGDVKLVYRVRESLDVALAANELTGNDEFFGIGLRYTW